MSDKSGFTLIYTMGDETDEVMEASIAVVARGASNRISSANKSTLLEKGLNTAVKLAGSKQGQAISDTGDNFIGNKIVQAAERNAANAWHSKTFGTLTLYKMLPKESEFLQGSKSFIKKGEGVLAVATLGLNAWDDFHNYGLVNGGKRFLVDLLGAGVGVGIGLLTAAIPGGVLLETGISIALNDAIFDPWKNSID